MSKPGLYTAGLYTATVRGVPNVLCEGEIINGRLNGLYPISSRVNKDFVLIGEAVDLQPVKVVPIDAVVIEGRLREKWAAIRNAMATREYVFGFPTTTRFLAEIETAFASQINGETVKEPEPEVIYPRVLASCPCSTAETRWTLGADGNWHTCRNGKWDAHAWRGLRFPTRVEDGA